MGSKILHFWQQFGLSNLIARLTSLLGSHLANYQLIAEAIKCVTSV